MVEKDTKSNGCTMHKENISKVPSSPLASEESEKVCSFFVPVHNFHRCFRILIQARMSDQMRCALH